MSKWETIVNESIPPQGRFAGFKKTTSRLRVEGGWLYKVQEGKIINTVFAPDPTEFTDADVDQFLEENAELISKLAEDD